MKKQLKPNRNSWSKHELETLNQYFKQSIPVSKAAKQAALALGRSASACTAKYYYNFHKERKVKARTLTSTPNVIQNTLSIPIKSFSIENNKLHITF